MKATRTRNALPITLVMLVSGAFAAAAAERPSMAGPEIRWETPAEGFVTAKTLTTYRAVPVSRVSDEQARERLDVLREATGTKGRFDGLKRIDGRLIFTSEEDASSVFDIDSATGTFLFNSGLKGYSDEGATRGLPSLKEAPETAREYLAKLRYLPMNEKELVVERVGGLAMAAAKEGKTSEPYHKLVTVYFGRVIDGLRVQGRGSRILVHLGENSALVGVIRSWAEVKPQEIDRDDVKRDDLILREIDRRLFRMADRAREVVIREAELVLFDDGRGVVEPAIHVVATARYEGPQRAKEGTEIPVDFYVPALLRSEAYYPFIQDAEARWPGGEKE